MLPFDKFPGADTLLGPEMRSTGEVMGIDVSFSKAYAKAAIAAGQRLPESGNVFMTMIDKYKDAGEELGRARSRAAREAAWRRRRQRGHGMACIGQTPGLN